MKKRPEANTAARMLGRSSCDAYRVEFLGMKSASLLALVALSVIGCSSFKASDTTRFYVLAAARTAQPAPASVPFAGLLFVAPVEVAAYLDNPGIVTRRGSDRVEFSERHQWAQPLHDDLTQALRDDLAGLVGNEHVHPSSRQRPRGPFVALQVRVDQFDLVERKTAVLAATWQLSDSDTGNRLLVRSSRIAKPLAAGAADFGDHVAVLGDALAELSREIAIALEQLPPPSKP